MPDAFVSIARYAREAATLQDPAYATARLCLADSLARAFAALRVPDCTRLLGPLVPGGVMPGGARVPGTSFELDPVQAAFNLGVMIRWHDVDGTALDRARPHPADTLGGLLSVADWLARCAILQGAMPPTVRDLLTALIKAYEIQGAVVATEDGDRVAGDLARPVRIATAAVATAMLRGSAEQVVAAVSHAWLDGSARHRRAMADAASRGVRHALMALRGEMSGDAIIAIALSQPLGSVMMERASSEFSAAEVAQKFAASVAAHFEPKQAARIPDLFADPAKLDAMPVQQFVAALVKNG